MATNERRYDTMRRKRQKRRVLTHKLTQLDLDLSEDNLDITDDAVQRMIDLDRSITQHSPAAHELLYRQQRQSEHSNFNHLDQVSITPTETDTNIATPISTADATTTPSGFTFYPGEYAHNPRELIRRQREHARAIIQQADQPDISTLASDVNSQSISSFDAFISAALGQNPPMFGGAWYTESWTREAERAFAEVACHVVIEGGDLAVRFSGVPIIQTRLNRVGNVNRTQEYINKEPTVRGPLRDIYGLDVVEDHIRTTLTFTDHSGCRVVAPLDDLHVVTSGDVATWRDEIVKGELQGEAKCSCGVPCVGKSVHTPEIHVVLKLDRTARMAAAHFEAVPTLEARVGEVVKEVEELRSEVVGLRMVKEDLEKRVGGGRKLRNRA